MTIRIAIGTEPRTEIARKVLEYSIVKTTNSSVGFHHLMGEDQADRGNLGEGTGFSTRRFSVPEYYNYEGHAIYLDADMLVLSDIAELWDLKNDTDTVWCCYGNESAEEIETSVMLINCKTAKGNIKTISEINEYLKNDINRKKYREIMKLKYLISAPVKLNKYFNVMDKGSVYTSLKDFRNPKAKILHFSEVRKQPWSMPKHPCRDIWEKWFVAALKDGYISSKEVKRAVAKFDVSIPRRPAGMSPYWLKFI